MKIALVANTAWNLVNYRLSLIKGLIEQGNEVLCLAPEVDQYRQLLMNTGVQLVELSALQRKGMNPLKEIQLIKELYSIFKSHKVELILSYTIKPNIYSCFAASKLNIPVICTVTGLGFSFTQKNWLNKIVVSLYKTAFKKAKFVVFQNRDDQNLFIEESICAEQKTILILGSGINTDLFKPSSGKSKDIFHYLFIGRLLKDKGVLELLEAFEKLCKEFKNVKLSFVGDIDMDNPAALSFTQFNRFKNIDAIEWVGQVQKVSEQLEKADVVVLPSYREGLPRVLLEAISMALPIITTDAPGCKEVIKDGFNGFKVPIKNSLALYEAMKKIYLLTDSDRTFMGVNGRKMALEKFSDQIVIKRYMELINKIKAD